MHVTAWVSALDAIMKNLKQRLSEQLDVLKIKSSWPCQTPDAVILIQEKLFSVSS